jgi:hypothetical protein
LSFRHEDDLNTIYKVLQEGVEHLRKTSPCDRLILEPLEIRTIAYALKLAGVSGAAALRFETIILEKVAALPADDALMTP